MTNKTKKRLEDSRRFQEFICTLKVIFDGRHDPGFNRKARALDNLDQVYEEANYREVSDLCCAGSLQNTFLFYQKNPELKGEEHPEHEKAIRSLREEGMKIIKDALEKYKHLLERDRYEELVNVRRDSMIPTKYSIYQRDERKEGAEMVRVSIVDSKSGAKIRES